jgi:hypothetical protein
MQSFSEPTLRNLKRLIRAEGDQTTPSAQPLAFTQQIAYILPTGEENDEGYVPCKVVLWNSVDEAWDEFGDVWAFCVVGEIDPDSEEPYFGLRFGELEIGGDTRPLFVLAAAVTMRFVKVTSITASSGKYPAIEQIRNPVAGTWANGAVCWYVDANGNAPTLNSYHLCLLVGNDGAGTPKKVYQDAAAGGTFTVRDESNTVSTTEELIWPDTSISPNGFGPENVVNEAGLGTTGLMSHGPSVQDIDGPKEFDDEVYFAGSPAAFGSSMMSSTDDGIHLGPGALETPNANWPIVSNNIMLEPYVSNTGSIGFDTDPTLADRTDGYGVYVDGTANHSQGAFGIGMPIHKTTSLYGFTAEGDDTPALTAQSYLISSQGIYTYPVEAGILSPVALNNGVRFRVGRGYPGVSGDTSHRIDRTLFPIPTFDPMTPDDAPWDVVQTAWSDDSKIWGVGFGAGDYGHVSISHIYLKEDPSGQTKTGLRFTAEQAGAGSSSRQMVLAGGGISVGPVGTGFDELAASAAYNVHNGVDLLPGASVTGLTTEMEWYSGLLVGTGGDPLGDLATLDTVTSSLVTDFNEAAQDAAGSMMTNSTRISTTYDDGAGTVTSDLITDTITAGYLHATDESVLYGRGEGAGGGGGEEITLSSALEMSGTVLDIVEFDGGGP